MPARPPACVPACLRAHLPRSRSLALSLSLSLPSKQLAANIVDKLDSMQNRLRYDCMNLVLNRLLPHVTSRVTWFRRNGCNGETVLMDYVRLFITHESLCRFQTWNDACGEFQCEYGTECVASGAGRQGAPLDDKHAKHFDQPVRSSLSVWHAATSVHFSVHLCSH